MTPSQPYVPISRRALDIEDYIDILRRHATWIMGPLFAGLVIACVTAFSMKNMYVSTAVMRILPAQISTTLVASTVTQQMADRIMQMQQEILGRNSLSELIQRPTMKLYPSEQASMPIEDVIERMRTRDVHIQIMGMGSQGASAFQISFQYHDRFKAQQVVQALISRFMESMTNVQRDQGKVTKDFFNDEIIQAKADLTRLDNELTEFRIQNAGHLPEDMGSNMATMGMLTQQLQGAHEALNRISEDKLTMETNLQTLQSQRDYEQQMAITTIDAANTRPATERLNQLNREIAQLEANLNQLRQVYRETYPDVRHFKAQIKLKKDERDELQAAEDLEAAKPKAAPKKITNPMILERVGQIQGSIDMVKTQMRNKESERLQRMKDVENLEKALAVYQNRIASSPPNQQKYAAMLREHAMADSKYQELQHKNSVANIFDDVGKKKAGEMLEVLENASTPESPTAPNRWLITGIGVGVGLMSGIFLTGLKEVKDTSLKNLKDVRAYTNLPILSSIPLLENDLLVRRKRRLAYVGWSAAVILGIVAMSGSMYYHYYLGS